MKKNTYKQPLAAIGLGLLATATTANAQQRSVDTDVATAPLTHSNAEHSSTAHSNTASSKLEFQWGDFDADGLEDAIVIQKDRSLQLLRNLGDGSFENYTTQAGLDGVAGARFALWQDFDKDGLKDLFIGTESGPSHLLHNAGTIFVDVTLQSGINSEGFDTGAHWVDYDGDGVLDLHLIRRSTNTLYHGLAAGGFEPITLPALYSENTSATHVDSGDTFVSNRVDSTDGTARNQREISRTRRSNTSGRSPLGPSGFPGTSTASAAVPSNNILACVQSLRDENGGSCIKASRVPMDGLLYPLGPDFFITPSGDVGIGTLTPGSKLHIPTGDDAQAGGNPGTGTGYVMLGGSGTGQLNVVIDDNEMMARSGEDPSQLLLNRDGGDVSIGGALGADPVRLGIGTTTPETNLHIPVGSDAQAGGGLGTGNGFVMLGTAGPGEANLVIDNNEIMARLDSQTALLYLNANGGNVSIGDDSSMVGIGTSSPSAQLDVADSFRADRDAEGGYTEWINDPGSMNEFVSAFTGNNAFGGLVHLNDSAGTRVTSNIDGFGGTFFLTDDTGVSNAFVADIDANGGKMSLRNNLNVNQVKLAVNAKGGIIALAEPTGVANGFVGSITPEGGLLDLRNHSNVTGVKVGLENTGGFLALRNGANSNRVVAQINSNDNGIFSLRGFTGAATVDMGGSQVAGGNSGFVRTSFGTSPLVINSSITGSPAAGAVAVYGNNVRTILLDGGNGGVSGTFKAFIQPHPTDATQQIRYISLEGPEHGVYFRGTAQVINGIAQIEVPESFRLVAKSEGLTVNVTPLGPTRGLYVSHKGLDYITVQEMPDGFGQVSFDYQVMGVRSALDALEPFEENVNFIAKPGLKVDVEGLPGNYGELMVQNGTLLPSGMPNEQTAALLGWTFDGEKWSHPTLPETLEATQSEEVNEPASLNSDTERETEPTWNAPTRTPAASQRKGIGARTAVPSREVNRRN